MLFWKVHTNCVVGAGHEKPAAFFGPRFAATTQLRIVPAAATFANPARSARLLSTVEPMG